MDIKMLGGAADALVDRLRSDGYSDEMVRNARWVLGNFAKWCEREGVRSVNREEAARFLLAQFDLPIDERDVTPAQCVIRKPLLTLLELEETGTYLKSHQRHPGPEPPPEQFAGAYAGYAALVGSSGLAGSTKALRLWRVRRFLLFLDSRGVRKIGDLTVADVHAYMGEPGRSPHENKRDGYSLRKALDWMGEEGLIAFGGRDAFPVVRARAYSPLPSRYTDEEVALILGSVDVATPAGKRDMLVLSLFAHYGMRCGDVAALRFADVDWCSGRIAIVQAKTGLRLSLPIVDGVRFPLLDYVRNARPRSNDPHVILTTHAPHTPYKSGSSFHRMVTRAIDRVGVDRSGRRHGGHALRHSAASGLLAAGVPLPTISSVLGHASTSATEAYLSVDEEGLAAIPPEVPHVRGW